MGILENQRHERFAQEIAKGTEIKEAAAIAGMEIKPCENLALYYVYALIDPRDQKPFYIGKGIRRRHAQHWANAISGRIDNGKKFRRLAEIIKAGERVIEMCILDGLSEPAAFKLERRLIAALGAERLTNMIGGRTSVPERAALWSRHWAERIMPFEDWMLSGKRTLQDVKWYFRVSLQLFDMAIEGEKRLEA